MNFPRGLFEKTCFFKRFYLFVEQTLLSHRTDTNFPRNPYFSPRTHTHFPGASIFSSNRYSFSRKPYLVLEHLRFSRSPYLVLKHIQFSRRSLCLEHIGIFQEGTPSRTDISLIGLGGCFRLFAFGRPPSPPSGRTYFLNAPYDIRNKKLYYLNVLKLR